MHVRIPRHQHVHRRTILALLFGLAFSATLAYAVPPLTKYNPAETLDPTCVPGDSNCSVLLPSGGSSQWDDVTGGINFAGGNVGIGATSPNSMLSIFNSATPTSFLEIGNSSTGRYLTLDDHVFKVGDVDSGTGALFTVDHPAQTFSFQRGRVGIGTTSPSTALDVVGEIKANNLTIAGASATIGTPSGLTATQTCVSGCSYTANGNRHNYRVYAYKIIGSTRIYSASYATLGANFVDDNSSASYDISVSWTPVSGASGYRVLKYDPDFYGYDFDAGYDTVAASFVDDGCASVCFNFSVNSVTPTSTYTNTNVINGNTTTIGGSLTIAGNLSSINGVSYIFPQTQSTNGQVLTNNGVGVLSWETPVVITPAITVQGSALISTGLSQSGSAVANSIFFGIGAGFNAVLSANSTFLGNNAGSEASGAFNSNFIGQNAGVQADDAFQSNFIGQNAGYTANSASDSNFFGPNAGNAATNASFSNFFGFNTGSLAVNAHDSSFIGSSAGSQATNAYNSNFLGGGSGYAATNANHSIFIGENTGSFAANANHSIFIGDNAGVYNSDALLGTPNAPHSIFIGANAGYFTADGSLDNTQNANDFSILIGNNTSTGGFSNSIALGANAVNTAVNQLMIGSTTRPINTTRINGAGSTQCTITTGTGIACTSDERLKTNIADLGTDTLENLLKVRTITYTWLQNPDTPQQIGFLAQDLEQYFPQLVATDQDGYKSVYYAQMTPILVEAIREINANITSLADLTKTNTWRDAIVAWLGNAENHITRIFTGEVCLTDTDGTSECINKTELGQLKQLLHAPVGGTSTPAIGTTTDTPTDDPSVDTTTSTETVPVTTPTTSTTPTSVEESTPSDAVSSDPAPQTNP